MPRSRLSAAAGVLVALALLPATSAAAVRSATDNDAGVRFRLDGRELTVDLSRQHPVVTFDGRSTSPSSGERVRAACGTSFRDDARRDRRTLVWTTARWPSGSAQARFRFRRDLSAAARWCVVESTSGSDVGSVSFRHAEPPRRLASGRGTDGRAWRLDVWRGDRLEPCDRLFVGGHWVASRCFEEQAQREARLDVDPRPISCAAGTYVVGVAPTSTARVDVVLGDGVSVAAQVLASPRRSRLRASWFVLPLRLTAVIRRVEAFDAGGRPVGVERFGGEPVSFDPCEP